jgi:tetratricopeptide (TPR) repeat protein
MPAIRPQIVDSGSPLVYQILLVYRLVHRNGILGHIYSNTSHEFHLERAAINAYQELLKRRPDGWLDVWLRKGALHALLNNNDEAVECYDRVLKIDPNFAKAWFYKGQALIKLSRNDAQYCLDKAKELGLNVSSLKKN